MANYPPPYPPPGAPGGPPYGNDWKYQRRMLKDQARAQRDMIRAQRDAYRYQARSLRRSSILGPLVAHQRRSCLPAHPDRTSAGGIVSGNGTAASGLSCS